MDLEDTRSFGKGLNSIPVRFGLMSLVLTSICVITLYGTQGGGWSSMTLPTFFLLAMLLIVPSLTTYLAASRLTRSIQALHRTTEVIASGDLTQPVEIDCSCEVGGLAVSFQKMVRRLNSSVIRMNALAHTDPVTGLPNRSVIKHVLERAANSQSDVAFSLIFIDLDDFKNVNDVFGHSAGDDLLRSVSTRLIEEGLRRTFNDVCQCTTAFGELCKDFPTDFLVSRFAGDEFIILAPGHHDDDLSNLAQRLIKTFSRPFLVADKPVNIGASIGIARFPYDTRQPTEMIALADFAMYEAKGSGKNKYVIFDDALLKSRNSYRELESDLRSAIHDGQMTLHYQPKVHAQSGELVGVEALVRWNHPTRGLLSPAVFVPIAEKSGLMCDLGAAVFGIALDQMTKWCAAGYRIPVAINVSPVQFENPYMAERLLSFVEMSQVDPSLIEIEITESMAMSDYEVASKRLTMLSNAGIRISIDDFGTGYSNLSQLSQLPVSVIKIDRSLTQQTVTPRGQAIITAIINMAHSLSHKVVAEGIETPDEAARLMRAHCDYLQGFMIGKPMPPDVLLNWLHSRQNKTAAVA